MMRPMSQSKTCPCFFEKKKVPGAHTSETGARASTKSEARTAGWGTDGQGKRDRKRDRVQLARQTASASNRSRLPRTQRTHSNNVRIPRDAQLRKVGARGTAHEALGGAGQAGPEGTRGHTGHSKQACQREATRESYFPGGTRVG